MVDGGGQKESVRPVTQQCEVCGGETRETTTDFLIRRPDEVIVVENVPAQVCAVCGEESFAPEVVRRLQETVWERRAPSRRVQATVFDFAAV